MAAIASGLVRGSLRTGVTASACLVCGLSVACRRAASQAGNRQSIAVQSAAALAATSSSGTASVLPPLSDVKWVEPLPLSDGNLAYVMPPIGAREPRPLIVAVHGAGDRPDWACGGWRLGANEYPFVVCPQGLKFDSLRFAWDSASTIASRVRAAMAAARQRFGPYIADGPTIYAGFSQGASLAGSVLLKQPERFPVVGA